MSYFYSHVAGLSCFPSVVDAEAF